MVKRTTVRLKDLGDVIQRRLEARLDKLQVDSPEFKRFVTTIGMRLMHETKLNIRSGGLVDTGRLFNSIAVRSRQGKNHVSLKVGSFGVRYAAAHEYGLADMDPKQRAAMFARLREEGKIGRPGKGRMVGSSLIARPFIGPAFDTVTKDLDQKLRELLRR